MHYLEMQVWENSEILEVDVVLVDWFYSQPPEMKICILTGLQHYLKLFGSWDTWLLLFENLIAYTPRVLKGLFTYFKRTFNTIAIYVNYN